MKVKMDSDGGLFRSVLRERKRVFDRLNQEGVSINTNECLDGFVDNDEKGEAL